MFRHHDISFKNSNMYNIKEYIPQNHDHQRLGHGNQTSTQGQQNHVFMHISYNGWSNIVIIY